MLKEEALGNESIKKCLAKTPPFIEEFAGKGPIEHLL